VVQDFFHPQHQALENLFVKDNRVQYRICSWFISDFPSSNGHLRVGNPFSDKAVSVRNMGIQTSTFGVRFKLALKHVF
jgi:hypothetical protein